MDQEIFFSLAHKKTDLNLIDDQTAMIQAVLLEQHQWYTEMLNHFPSLSLHQMHCRIFIMPLDFYRLASYAEHEYTDLTYFQERNSCK